jgi:tetratricopeptide (TPR) repeat protein
MSESTTGADAITPELLERFLERIAESLQERPHTIPTVELRRHAADLAPRAGANDHYELLGLASGATTEQVTAAYTELARRVHPSLGALLGLPADVLRMLFERATLAYLVLSDPERRRDYDDEIGVVVQPTARTPEELAAVRKDLAAKSFQRARAMMRSEQYHYVVELLRDPVRWDPRPEMLALLGEAQAKNPRWRDDALENLRQAVAMAPKEVAYRVHMARVLEDLERVKEAVEEYKHVLEQVPNQPEATEAMERLGHGSAGKGKR